MRSNYPARGQLALTKVVVCKTAGSAYAGSSPASPIRVKLGRVGRPTGSLARTSAAFGGAMRRPVGCIGSRFERPPSLPKSASDPAFSQSQDSRKKAVYDFHSRASRANCVSAWGNVQKRRARPEGIVVRHQERCAGGEELQALRWQDVDFGEGVIRVERGWDERVARTAEKPCRRREGCPYLSLCRYTQHSLTARCTTETAPTVGLGRHTSTALSARAGRCRLRLRT